MYLRNKREGKTQKWYENTTAAVMAIAIPGTLVFGALGMNLKDTPIQMAFLSVVLVVIAFSVALLVLFLFLNWFMRWIQRSSKEEEIQQSLEQSNDATRKVYKKITKNFVNSLFQDTPVPILKKKKKSWR